MNKKIEAIVFFAIFFITTFILMYFDLYIRYVALIATLAAWFGRIICIIFFYYKKRRGKYPTN